MIEKIKKLPGISESEVIRIDFDNRLFERFDLTLRVVEKIPTTILLEGEGEVYVTAEELLPLLQSTKSITKQGTAAIIQLTNSAKYSLAGRAITFRKPKDIEMPKEFFTIKLPEQLTITTLKNLLDPILQTIYIDKESAVSTNSIVACIENSTTSPEPMLIPQDLIQVIQGIEVQLGLTSDIIIVKTTDARVFAPRITIPEQHNFIITRDYVKVAEELEYIETKGLEDSLKRLSAFGEFISFHNDRVWVGENWEPFVGIEAGESFFYSVAYLIQMMPKVKSIAVGSGILYLKGETSTFLVSPKED